MAERSKTTPTSTEFLSINATTYLVSIRSLHLHHRALVAFQHAHEKLDGGVQTFDVLRHRNQVKRNGYSSDVLLTSPWLSVIVLIPVQSPGSIPEMVKSGTVLPAVFYRCCRTNKEALWPTKGAVLSTQTRDPFWSITE